MAKIEQQIESAHNWVHLAPRQEVRLNTGYHKHLGSRSTLVDQMFIPFLDTTYVLAFESSWGTTGGIKKDAVLYAYNHHANNSREVSRHTISNGRDAMSPFYPTKIGANICFETKDYPTLESWEYRLRGSRQLLRVGAFTREHWVVVNISMRRGDDARARCEISGHYETGGIERVLSGFTGYRHEMVPVSSRTWTTGEVESSVLTKRNISRFYGKYTSELPAIPETKAV